MDSAYVLKLVMYLVLGTQWLFLIDPEGIRQFPIPAGLVIGMVLASHDQFQIDRKIEYAVLLVAASIGFWARIGLQLII